MKNSVGGEWCGAGGGDGGGGGLGTMWDQAGWVGEGIGANGGERGRMGGRAIIYE